MIDAPGVNNVQKIDWSKAPEWARAVVEATCGSRFWVDKLGGVSVRQNLAATRPDSEVARMIGSHAWTLVETRPTETPAWSGEGLPPVGTVCEFHWSQHEWKQCTVFALHPNGNGGVDALVDIYGDWTFSSEPERFRPIRTPEQIAEEARGAAVDEMVDVWRRTTGRFAVEERGLAAMLYDAGYRKVKQP